VAILRFTARAQRDIRQVLAFTVTRFGTHQRAEYAALIADAVHALEEGPEHGKQRPDIASGVWTLHISQPGRRARHLFVYRIAEAGKVVEVLALLYDGMDLPNWLRSSRSM
jgi:plasmid stabilization system protein ParE